MTNAELARALVEALDAGAAREAECALVSVTLDLVSAGGGDIAVSVTRRARTLLFMAAEVRNGNGALIAAANAVYKILEA